MMKNEKGITLIELLIVLALLGIVLAIGYNIYFFGQRTFTIGETQTNLQRDVRFASAFITREVRYATELEVRNDVDNVSGYNYIYLNNNRITHRNASGQITEKTYAVIDLMSFVVVKPVGVNNFLLGFTINGSDEDRSYDLESEVMLYNLKNVTENSDIVVKYKKP